MRPFAWRVNDVGCPVAAEGSVVPSVGLGIGVMNCSLVSMVTNGAEVGEAGEGLVDVCFVCGIVDLDSVFVCAVEVHVEVADTGNVDGELVSIRVEPPEEEQDKSKIAGAVTAKKVVIQRHQNFFHILGFSLQASPNHFSLRHNRRLIGFPPNSIWKTNRICSKDKHWSIRTWGQD